MNSIDRLLAIMARLRDKKSGCPWDVEQDFASIAPCTIEEAYEVVDAIERGDMKDLKEELGDLLLQVVFHAQMAKEAKLFDFSDLAQAVSDKLERRHPHVFGDAKIETADEQVNSWEKIKAEEKRSKSDGKRASVLDDIPVALPSMTRAHKMLKKAAKTGFDWPTISPVFDKLNEEIGELKKAINTEIPEDILDEVGDILFVAVNIAKHLKVDPDTALRHTMKKYENRFRYMEDQLARQQMEFKDMSLQQLEELWDQARALERL